MLSSILRSIQRITHLLLILIYAAPIFFACSYLNAAEPVRRYIQSEQEPLYDSLLAEYGKNKELPEGYELQALLALSHYPELRDIKIKFVLNDVDIAISSRPHWTGVFKGAKKRTYLVVIDTEREGPRPSLILKNQPFNAQVGILGHELAHTVYYLNRSFFGVSGDGFCQLTRCRVNFERNTDLRLIDYGLGWQRFDHSMFLRTSNIPDAEIAFNAVGASGAYMSPRELLENMEASGLYGDFEISPSEYFENAPQRAVTNEAISP